MNSKPKYNKAIIIGAICCAIGITLMLLPKFMDTEANWATMGMAANGIGLIIFLYGIQRQ